jgi:hypothetical protein
MMMVEAGVVISSVRAAIELLKAFGLYDGLVEQFEARLREAGEELQPLLQLAEDVHSSVFGATVRAKVAAASLANPATMKPGRVAGEAERDMEPVAEPKLGPLLHYDGEAKGWRSTDPVQREEVGWVSDDRLREMDFEHADAQKGRKRPTVDGGTYFDEEGRPRYRVEGVGLRVLLGLVLVVMLAGCSALEHRVVEQPETEDQFRTYGVVWPADVSRDPGHFVTVEVDGAMVTTVPAVGEGGLPVESDGGED